MERWFTINQKYYQLSEFSHFEPEKTYMREKWTIKGYFNFAWTHDEETHPHIMTQAWATIGGYENDYSTEQEAADAIESIIKGKFDLLYPTPEKTFQRTVEESLQTIADVLWEKQESELKSKGSKP